MLTDRAGCPQCRRKLIRRLKGEPWTEPGFGPGLPVRHYGAEYALAPYIGRGTPRDPFRPSVADQLGWSAIDLRPDGGATREGGGLNAALVWTPERSRHAVALAEHPDERLGTPASTPRQPAGGDAPSRAPP